MSRSSVVGNGELDDQKRKESMISVISDPNVVGSVKSKKTFVSDTESFVPSKHFDFRFSREKLLEIKRGMWP
jgi:hypothetical protein